VLVRRGVGKTCFLCALCSGYKGIALVFVEGVVVFAMCLVKSARTRWLEYLTVGNRGL
jgi:hypothetical protein